MALLRLKLAKLWIQGADYSDQCLGIDATTSALKQLAKLGDRLPPEQKALL